MTQWPAWQNSCYKSDIYMDVSKNRGTQNGWFIMENPMNKWMIWFFSHIFGNTHMKSHLWIQGTASKILDVSPTWDLSVAPRLRLAIKMDCPRGNQIGDAVQEVPTKSIRAFLQVKTWSTYGDVLWGSLLCYSSKCLLKRDCGFCKNRRRAHEILDQCI